MYEVGLIVVAGVLGMCWIEMHHWRSEYQREKSRADDWQNDYVMIGKARSRAEEKLSRERHARADLSRALWEASARNADLMMLEEENAILRVEKTELLNRARVWRILARTYSGPLLSPDYEEVP